MARAKYRRNANRERELMALIDEGVMAGAEAMQAAVIGEFEQRDLGYTSGDFANGDAANIQIDGPYTKRGVRRADVYSPASRMGEDGATFYPALWEFGHWNIFMPDENGHRPSFQRVETFAPALYENASRIGGIMARQIKQSPFLDKYSKKSGGITTGVKLSDFGL